MQGSGGKAPRARARVREPGSGAAPREPSAITGLNLWKYVGTRVGPLDAQSRGSDRVET